MKKTNKLSKFVRNTIMALTAALMLAGGATKAEAKEITNPKDISSGAEVAGVVHGYDDMNFYKYTASASGYVYFSLRQASVTTDNPEWKMSLYDSDGVKVDSRYGNSISTQKTMVQAGTSYFIGVENNSGARGINYRVKANYVACPAVVAEPNSGAYNAKEVAFGCEYLGVIDNSDDGDYFKITAPQSGYVLIDLKRYEINTTEVPEWNFDVYDSSMNSLYQIKSRLDIDAHNTENVYYVLSKNQTIYVRITRNNSKAVGQLYSFKTRFTAAKNVEKEGNNDYSKANNIKLKKTYYGVLGETTGDYFKFKTKGGGKYKITLKLGKDVKYGYSIKVYDSSRKLVASTKKNVYKSRTLKFRARGHKKYYVVLEHGDVSFFFGGGRTLGTLYKLKVSK